MYLRPETGNLTLVGGSTNVDRVDPDDYPEGASDALRAEIAATDLHGMDQAVMRGGMAGVYTMSADGHFILDRAPGVEGLYVASGCSGTGFKIAPAVGIGMAELITEGRASSVDLAPFRASRFAEGRCAASMSTTIATMTRGRWTPQGCEWLPRPRREPVVV